MIRTLTLIILFCFCASGNGGGLTDADGANENSSSLELITIEGTAPHSTLTIFNLNSNSNVSSSQLTTKANFTTKPHRIVGGQRIAVSEVPWQCALMQENFFVCGCSIISRFWVLTAAHCVYETGHLTHTIRAGSDQFRQGGQLRQVALFTYHGKYNPIFVGFDIGMLRVRRPFRLNSRVQPVNLPTSEAKIGTYFVSGWGTLRENQRGVPRYLRGVLLNFVNRTQCANAYRGELRITNQQICAQAPNKDACQGDSGGALVNRGTQYGIVSSGNGCARPNYPGIYTNVYPFISWIRRVRQALSAINT